ncbi:hypothetical protein [Mucilaginibacter oryzae]|uniref:hypothetical protein n=1 Tax=Mucilaginibacter oryzae TaxID=468058 RepID=UPI001475437A|nr:hypothetical protein [Mucilaginibacter oryzae]
MLIYIYKSVDAPVNFSGEMIVLIITAIRILFNVIAWQVSLPARLSPKIKLNKR